MAFLDGFKDFAEGLARGLGLFIFERNDYAGRAIAPGVGNTDR